MIIYLGDTRSRKLLARIDALTTRTPRRDALGVGQVVVRGRLGTWLRRAATTRHFEHCEASCPHAHPRRWIYDNGAWVDHVQGRPFDADTWRRELDTIAGLPRRLMPDFAVLPDRVAAGRESLELSLDWLARAPYPCSWYLAVQDGVTPADIPDHPRLDGIFVGGSLPWKVRTLAAWAAFGRRSGLTVHVGRVGTPGRLLACRAADVTSVDSSLPLFSDEKWRAYFRALDQLSLPLGGAS